MITDEDLRAAEEWARKNAPSVFSDHYTSEDLAVEAYLAALEHERKRQNEQTRKALAGEGSGIIEQVGEGKNE